MCIINNEPLILAVNRMKLSIKVKQLTWFLWETSKLVGPLREMIC